jgi:hypothetical protein
LVYNEQFPKGTPEEDASTGFVEMDFNVKSVKPMKTSLL